MPEENTVNFDFPQKMCKYILFFSFQGHARFTYRHVHHADSYIYEKQTLKSNHHPKEFLHDVSLMVSICPIK